MGRLERIADKLLGRGKAEKRRSVSRDNRGGFSSPVGGYSSPYQLKEDLLKEYRGSDLLSETDFQLVSTDYGDTLHSSQLVEQPFYTPETSPKDILEDLKLVHGIGPAREKELKKKEFRTVADLVEHQKWGEEAEAVNRAFHRDDLSEAYGILRRWKSLSDPTLLELAGLVDKEEFGFVDIETLGLSNQPIFLLGLARPLDNGIAVHQFLAGDLSQEMATLARFSGKLDDLGIILTYNGRNFDIPYIERRLAYYGNRKKFSQPHLDLYLFAREVFSDRTRNCQLNTIERSILGIQRDLDVPSRLVPEFYRTYREKGNPGPLLPVLAHHRQDMLSLADLFHELTGELLDGYK